MTVPLSNRFDSVASAGGSTGLSGLVPVVTIRAPAASDIRGPYGPFKIGQLWVNSTANVSYVLTSLVPSAGFITANWAEVSNRSSFLETLTGNSGVATAVAGNINTLGTTNQITTTGSGSTLTLSIPSSFVAPGSVAATTTVTATLGAITATNGNLVLGTAGNKLVSTSVGSSAAAGNNSFGKVDLVDGTVTVATTAVTASSIILLTRQIAITATEPGGLGLISVGTVVNGTSFVINALSPADASTETNDISTIGWMIIN